ncbi:MAG: glycosyltransferase family 2 protein [Pseudomonadota bacterium]
MKLSICIPTYNFGAFIGATLDSILPQLTAEVEVVVLDGGSSDDTVSVVRQRQNDYPALRLFEQGFRGGIDRDIDKVVGLAHGQYCWIFSADDLMFEGAIAKMLAYLVSGDDIYLCEHLPCTLDMTPIGPYPLLQEPHREVVFDLAKPGQQLAYFSRARTSEAFFSFLATPIFRKGIWDRADVPDAVYGSCWIVAGRLLRTFESGVRLRYLARTLLYKRGDNDSFADKGLVNRLRITLENFPEIASQVFGEDSAELVQVRRVLRTDIPLRIVLFAKAQCARNPQGEDRALLDRLVRAHYGNAGAGNLLRYWLYQLLPATALVALDNFRKHGKAKKKSNAPSREN